MVYYTEWSRLQLIVRYNFVKRYLTEFMKWNDNEAALFVRLSHYFMIEVNERIF
jgi:hypothetical protein